jgi:hypothetical protein
VPQYIRVVRDIRYNDNLAANEELFWDHYVNEWEKAGKSGKLRYVRSEFKHDEHFLALLQKYPSLEKKLSRSDTAVQLRRQAANFLSLSMQPIFLPK